MLAREREGDEDRKKEQGRELKGGIKKGNYNKRRNRKMSERVCVFV